MARQIDEFTKGKQVTIAEVINDLKEQGYNIEEIVSGEDIVTDIVLNNNEVKINKNSEKTITYTLIYGQANVRYFVEIDRKYYEINFNKGKIEVSTEETDLDVINKKPKISVESDNENIVTGMAIEGKDEIKLSAQNTTGETTIIIKEENNGAITTCKVKVIIAIEEITIKQTNANVDKGTTLQLDVTLNPKDATEKVIFRSSNENIATVTEEGLVTGIEKGTATITVSNEEGTINRTCIITVTIPATGISLNKSAITVGNGQNETLQVKLEPENTTDTVSWETENKDIATVQANATGRNATIRGVGIGVVKITVRCGSKIAYCTITVVSLINSITLDQQNVEIIIGDTLQLTGTINPEDATEKVIFSSDNTNIATVTSDGLIILKAYGTTKIWAKGEAGKASAYCEVRVIELFSVLDYMKNHNISVESVFNAYVGPKGDRTSLSNLTGRRWTTRY